jgi:CRP/FNR family cyclic AMP-dependent transcriptional regulator
MRKSLYFLGILNDSDIDWLIAAGANLIEEGVPADSVFLVIEGQFSVRTAALGTREIARRMSGEMLGEMSFVDSAPSIRNGPRAGAFVLSFDSVPPSQCPAGRG